MKIGIAWMPYLNLDLDFLEHPKIIRLKARLGSHGIVALIRLWLFAGKYHPKDGDISQYTKEEIDGFAGWYGNDECYKQCFTDACVELGVIDKKSNGKIMLHDWKKHQGHLQTFKERGERAARIRWDRYAAQNKETQQHPSNATSIPQAKLEQCLTNAPNSSPLLSSDLKDKDKNTENSKKNSSGDAPKQTDHQKLIDHFCQLYEEQYKIKYSFSGGKDGKAIKELLKAFDLEFCIKIVNQLFKSTDEFYDKGGGRTIGVLLANRNKLAQEIVQNLDPKSKFSPAAQRTIENIRQVIAEEKEIIDVSD